MKIGDLIERLEQIRDAYGDLWVEDNGGMLRMAEDVVVVDAEGQDYVEQRNGAAPVAIRIAEDDAR